VLSGHYFELQQIQSEGGITEDLFYSVYIHSGLMTSSNSSYSVRSGRQKVTKANASALAATIALRLEKTYTDTTEEGPTFPTNH